MTKKEQPFDKLRANGCVLAQSLVLASSSPRRRELIARLGIEPSRIAAPDVDETPLKNEGPRDYALRIAIAKAHAVPRAPGEVILAADTTVAAGRRILGKPSDEADLRRMLALLSGRRHHCQRSSTGSPTGHGADTPSWRKAAPDSEEAQSLATQNPEARRPGHSSANCHRH